MCAFRILCKFEFYLTIGRIVKHQFADVKDPPQNGPCDAPNLLRFAPLAHVNNVALSIVVRCIYVEAGVRGGGRVSWRELVCTNVRA